MKKILLILLIIGILVSSYLTYSIVKNNKIYKNEDVLIDYDELIYYKLYAIVTRYSEMFEDKFEIKKINNIDAKKVFAATGIKCKTKDYNKCIEEYYDLDKYIDSEKEKILELRAHVSQEKSNLTSNIIYYLDDIRRINLKNGNKEIYNKYNTLKNNLENSLSDFRKTK